MQKVTFLAVLSLVFGYKVELLHEPGEIGLNKYYIALSDGILHLYGKSSKI